MLAARLPLGAWNESGVRHARREPTCFNRLSRMARSVPALRITTLTASALAKSALRHNFSLRNCEHAPPAKHPPGEKKAARAVRFCRYAYRLRPYPAIHARSKFQRRAIGHRTAFAALRRLARRNSTSARPQTSAEGRKTISCRKPSPKNPALRRLVSARLLAIYRRRSKPPSRPRGPRTPSHRR
jgi:hypothetical protein